jgi:nitrate/nitrite transport system ATP-binding protein
MITNDVDEGILLADRIIPLSAGPGATLGPELVVDIPRPRDRTAINHNERFKAIRREITDYLLDSRGRQRVTVSKKLQLPDLEPEDLWAPRSRAELRDGPVRRATMRRETVEI